MKRRAGKAERQVHATDPEPNDSDPPGVEQVLPVVGIGASAGGLEAFTNLLKHLPPDTGMAFVFVQHLDPSHASVLSEILARSTTMPVTEIGNGDLLEPNHVYVIPPGTNLGVSGDVLTVQARSRDRRQQRPIDVFFESLARDRRERAVGVVLSGTGNDGTLGLEAIKSEGGITFAQDDSARHASMPQSAIAAAVVDIVKSPAGIGKELARIATHPYGVGRFPRVSPARDHDASEARSTGEEHDLAAASAVPGVADSDAYRKILLLLKNHSGVDFARYRSTTVHRRVNRRTLLKRHDTLREYADFLKGNIQELDALYTDVLISVTGFFRNGDAFDVLQREVLPTLFDRRDESPVRCWVLGCSTGQEAYSIAMLFVEAEDRTPRARKFQIFATDLNEKVLEKARNGLYARSIEDDVSPERLRRFFTEEDGGYRVNKSLREMVVFARHNLLGDPPFSRMDLVSCRNLLIYLEPEVQKRALPTFHYALNRGGFLFLGASESIGPFTDLFNVVDRKHKIYSKRPAQIPLQMASGDGRATEKPDRTLVATHLNARLPMRRVATGQGETVRHDQSPQSEADRIVSHQFAPPGVLVNDDMHVVQFRGMTDPWLEPPVGNASFDLLKMAREGLTMSLRAAITEARKAGNTVRRENVRFKRDGATRTVNILVTPLKNQPDLHYLVLFEHVAKTGRASRPRREEKLPKAEEPTRIAELEAELAETRQYLQSTQEEQEAANEELQSANEEAQSANEELQSVNEELETSKEELESTNEELRTVNEEMQSRNVDLLRLNNDLLNFQNSINTALILLGRDLTIRRFSAHAQKVLHLQISDSGRQVRYLRHGLSREMPGGPEPIDLEAIASRVMDMRDELAYEVRQDEGRWYLLRVRPYLSDNQVDGVVVVLTDMNDLKQAAEKVAEARDYATSIVETLREPLVVLDRDLRVERANRAFYQAYRIAEQETVGRFIYDLSDRQWDIPRLRQLLEEILPQKTTIEGFRVAHEFRTIGLRIMLLNARQLIDPARRSSRILLAIEDVTDQEHAIEVLRRLATITPAPESEAPAGELDALISDWNDSAQRLFGYAAEEAIGKPVVLLIPEERLDEEAEILANVRRGESIEHYETVRRRKDGTLLNISLSTSPLRDEQGRVVGAVRIAREITDRIRAELESQLRAVELVQSSDVAGGRTREMDLLWELKEFHERLGEAAQYRLEFKGGQDEGEARETKDPRRD